MCVYLCDVRVCVGKFIVGECAAGPLYKTMQVCAQGCGSVSNGECYV